MCAVNFKLFFITETLMESVQFLAAGKFIVDCVCDVGFVGDDFKLDIILPDVDAICRKVEDDR